MNSKRAKKLRKLARQHGVSYKATKAEYKRALSETNQPNRNGKEVSSVR